MKPLNLIVSCAENRVMGRDGRLPWSIPEDQRFLRQKTRGQVVVMGRICFETWPSAATDGRRVIVVTSRSSLGKPGVQRARSLPEALALAEELPGEVFILGGERIFAEAIALPQAARVYLTLVHAEVPGDRHFPDWTGRFSRQTERRDSSGGGWTYSFLTLER